MKLRVLPFSAAASLVAIAAAVAVSTLPRSAAGETNSSGTPSGPPSASAPAPASAPVAGVPEPAKPAEKNKKSETPPPKPENGTKPKPKPGPASPAPAAPAEKKPENVHTVKEGPFELKVELNGVFEALKGTKLSVNPDEWASLTVIEAVPHGAAVKQDDILVRFDTEKLEEQLRNLRLDRPLAQLNLDLAQQSLDALEKSTPLNLETARRSKMEAEQDLAYFEDIGRELREERARREVQESEQYLEYVEEELKQLEKMYEADDLTEETEEIIVRRARNSVDSSRWNLHYNKINSERQLNTLIPREHVNLKNSVANQDIAWRTAEQAIPGELQKRRLEIAKQKRDFEKEAERIRDLESDLAIMQVKAPHDGIVYYGAAEYGKWTTASTVDKNLLPGGSLRPREVFMTVVDPAQVRIRAAIAEKDLQHLKEGLQATASPVSDPDMKLPATLESISYVPLQNNQFDSVVTLEKPAQDRLYPGMNCKVELSVYKNDKALTVPDKALTKEGDDSFVTLKNGEKRKVKPGKSDGKVTEILEGLKAGDIVKIEG